MCVGMVHGVGMVHVSRYSKKYFCCWKSAGGRSEAGLEYLSNRAVFAG